MKTLLLLPLLVLAIFSLCNCENEDSPTSIHTVKFDARGGSLVTTQYVKDHGYATNPESPTRTGFQFVQWQSDTLNNVEFNFGGPIVRDTTIYAKWSPKTFGQNDIVSFKFLKADNPNLKSDIVATIDEQKKLITFTTLYGSDLKPLIQINGKTISPASGVVKNFIDTITYTVTSAEGSTQIYHVVALSTWRQETSMANFSARYGHTSVVYKDKMWVIGGKEGNGNYQNDVWYSADGKLWEQAPKAPFSERYGHTSVVYKDKMWVIGGRAKNEFKNDVWFTADGNVWEQASTPAFSERYDYISIVYKDTLWLTGGYGGTSYKNDVWFTTDGNVWTQAPSAGFTPRYDFSAAVYRDTVWVIGGEDGIFKFKKDVWVTGDFRTWTQAPMLPFEKREDHTSLEYDGKLWVVAGGDDVGSGDLNDAWFTTDGRGWTQATKNPVFTIREDHTSVVYKGRLWVIAGQSGSHAQNDVWSAEAK